MHDKISAEEQVLIDKFLADNKLFLGPDPEIMRNHSIQPRSSVEDEILKKGLDTHQVHHVRGLINAALSEAFSMVNQMGAAPGAKWGDLVTGIYTAQGDLAMIAPHGIIAFAACCFYPIRFIIKNWITDPTVGVKDGDGFIHNDARYGGVHNTDQSMMMPLFYKGELVCWLSSTIHEGENGACEPGGMPAAAESKYDEGIKMSPFKVVENFRLKRDLVTFLQNSVRDPKLQLEDMKVKLHAVMRLRERIIAILDQFGRDALMGTLRLHLEDTETEMRRRIREMPDGTTRVLQFMDSSLRENCLQKLSLAITVKGERLIMDFRGSAPQFMNRAVNTNIASFKAALCTGLLQNIWPDLPHTMAVLSPIEIISDRNSIIDAEGEMPQAMSLMPMFKACVAWTIPMNKLNYSVPTRYSAIIASQYDQAATFIYGGLTQHGDVTGNFCSDINGNGQGARSHADGEHSVSPVFGFMCDSGEQEINEEDTPIIRLGAQRLAKDRIGWGKYRGGMGYEQIATARGSGMWGFMTGCEGSKFPSAQGLFGGYSCPSYQLLKIKGINIFEELRKDPKVVEVFDIVELMNKQPIKGGQYSSNDMGMTFELCNEGEIYMICQGSGGGYGDVLERDPKLVMKDLAEDLMSHENARDIYKVVYDEKTLIVDEQATAELRAQTRLARIQRGKPFEQFCIEWVKPEPPTNVPYFGSWNDNSVIWTVNPAIGLRSNMPASAMSGVFMPNPKDLQILQLQAQNEALKAKLAACESKA
ncbi:N-methylhydantoinase B/oxoprolinase/acetone carboxylase, alpha subunit [Solimonas aquatica]|uniref:N-methylhydantoinase B/oxoprolinase/acetone carboxylase, alpha subunit n=1 Tax=Solimonas aquatica TaxID=489703 RepID=A0A1H9E5V4_9GAMM|nr:hydantoinase B/oxoprolinase family protein [Solimonas aquatica]SEQ20623.1 N-methylhydantoinase B/oxoprolinase/acetone carboxylase, alpha subunit [Solimonas aquatica]